jgi:two-component system sensor histidine kinase VicK
LALSSSSSPSDEDHEKTEILYGIDNVISHTLSHFMNTKHQIDACMNSQGIIVLIETEKVWNGLKDLLRSAAVRGRAITQITEENIPYCKKLMQFAEVRHLDNVKGSFSIADKKEYHGTAIVQRSKPVIQIISSTVTAFVEQQQYFFDTLWDKSIPAEQKIREIKEGVEPDFIQPITNPMEIQRIQYDLLSSSSMEILLIFPTSGIFTYYEENLGIIQLFAKLSTANPSLQIKIMMPDNHKLRNSGQKLRELHPKNIDIQYLTQQPETTILILVVDRKHSLYIEVKDTGNALGYGDDIRSNMDDIFGLATFSNSKATVVGYASVFESLWKQSEVYEQLKEKQKHKPC